MRRYGYIIAFIAVLLVAGIGGFFGGRLLLDRLQRDFAPPSAGWTPAAPTPVAQTGAGPTLAPPQAVPPTLPPGPTATVLVVPSPAGVSTLQPAAPTLAPGATATETASPTPSPTAEESSTPAPVYPYALARPVRYSAGDCPGTYILGQVTDRAGNPLPDVRLYLVDQYGNAATAVSKSSAGDAGRYDFPIGGPARRFFLTVIDAGGQQLSPREEIGFGLAPNPQATCFWADWVRR